MSEPTPQPRPVPGAPVPGPPAPGAHLPKPPVPGPAAVPAAPTAGDAQDAQDVHDVHDAPDLGEHTTGDIVIDSALQDLRDAPADDLDAQIEAGRRVHQTLQGRLSHLGGE
ncbi:hypothetical protein GCM10009867_00040 [Pedococcus aerophilus]|uniref:Uncharacterized protein n=1 Tax=Pedococcus aerophilus TaxID=436356 RepID=A0ABP6GRB2_9MICO